MLPEETNIAKVQHHVQRDTLLHMEVIIISHRCLLCQVIDESRTSVETSVV